MPVYVDPTNAEDISRALIRCIEDSAYKVPGQKDIAILRKKYQWKTVAVSTKTRMKRVYKEAYESCDSL